MAIECDVLVVGAGPAGSSAAIATSNKGAKVVVLERKRAVGIPVHCAGLLSEFLIPFLPFKIPEEFLLWKNNGVAFTTDDITVRRKGGIWSSYAINRSRFDSWLAENAVKAGADLRLETEFIDLRLDNEYNVEKAVATTKIGEEIITPKVLIAADGADSTTSKKAGVRKKDCLMGRGLVYEFRDVKLSKADIAQIFFGNFIPGGYAYIFPTSNNSANIGVGSILKDVDLERSFQEFCSLPEIKKQLQNAKKTANRSGNVPFNHPIDKIRYGNVLFAGDSAGQNMKPLVEGFLPAIICGTIAGETAAEHIAKKSSLSLYEENLRNKMGSLFGITDKYIEVLDELSHTKEEKSYLTMMGLCSDIFSVDDLRELKNTGYDEIKRMIEDWNTSRTKQLKTTLEENLLMSYLRFLNYRNLFRI